ncbi:MAG: RNase H-like domain-containing protein, partial [Candidatus Thiodiazotropha sp.]
MKRRKRVPVKMNAHDTNFELRWTEKCTMAFETLKTSLISAPILGFPDFTKSFVVETDASFKGLGAVLSQDQPQGRVVIAYASRALRPAERKMDNYSSLKLEMLALKWAVCEKFRDYLLGSKFIVFTDNNPLSYLQTAKLDAKEMRWAAQLAQFDFSVKYRSGKANQNADALSRQPAGNGVVDDVQVTEQGVEISMGPSEWLNERTNSVGLGVPLRRAIASDLGTCIRVESTDIAIDSVPTFPSFESSELKSKQELDHHIAQVVKWLKTGHKPTDRQRGLESAATRKMLRKWERLELKEGVLWYKSKMSDGEDVITFVTPESMKNTVLASLHDASGHQGIERTLALVRRRCYWIGLDADVRNWIR